MGEGKKAGLLYISARKLHNEEKKLDGSGEIL
jgi:hypothetical protein